MASAGGSTLEMCAGCGGTKGRPWGALVIVKACAKCKAAGAK